MAALQNATDLSGFECSICLELLCEPMQLPCSHVFCRKCLASVVRQSRHCALCRASIPESFDPIVAPLNQELEQVLMRQCTVEYTQRMEDVAAEAAHLVRLHIGNQYEFLGFGRQMHRWTLKVELEPQPEACLPRGAKLPDIIKHVRFGLPAACRVQSYGSWAASETEKSEKPPRYIEVSDDAFEVTATSPMSCTICIVVTWQDWVGQPPLRLEHALDFCREGGCWDYGVDLHAALTGNASEDVVQTSQRTSPRHHYTHTTSAGQHYTTPCQQGVSIHESRQSRGKSTGMFSRGLAEMRRHLPKLR